MHLNHLEKNFQKREKRGLIYKLNTPASGIVIEDAEDRMGVKFPDQVKMFYENCNGLNVENPALSIFAAESLETENGLIHFSIIDKKHKISFDTRTINDAGQWNIINENTGYLITLTLASFWSNKIWAWIDKQRTVWQKEYYRFPESMS